jgi:hypothetical protein
LDQKERSRVRRLAKVKTKEAKTKKSKRKHDKLAEDTKIAKKELHRREGTYRRGMNLDDPEDEAEGTDDRPPKRARLTSTNTKGNHCEYCGKSNHLTKRSKKCTAQEVVVKRSPPCQQMEFLCHLEQEQSLLICQRRLSSHNRIAMRWIQCLLMQSMIQS